MESSYEIDTLIREFEQTSKIAVSDYVDCNVSRNSKAYPGDTTQRQKLAIQQLEGHTGPRRPYTRRSLKLGRDQIFF